MMHRGQQQHEHIIALYATLGLNNIGNDLICIGAAFPLAISLSIPTPLIHTFATPACMALSLITIICMRLLLPLNSNFWSVMKVSLMRVLLMKRVVVNIAA